MGGTPCPSGDSASRDQTPLPALSPFPSLQQGEEEVEELVGQGRAFLAQLRAELDLDTPLEATQQRQAPGEPSGIPTPNREPLGEGLGLISTQLCAQAVATGGVPNGVFAQGWCRGRSVSWCPHSLGWRRRRQVWAEVSTPQPPGAAGCHRDAGDGKPSLGFAPWGWWRRSAPTCSPTPSPSLSCPPPGAAACPGLNASALRVGALQELYAWVLRVPEPDLAMTFQEVRACGGHPRHLTVPSLPATCPPALGLTVFSSPGRSWWTWAPKTPRGCTGRRCGPRWAAAPRLSPASWGWRATRWPVACLALSL